MSSHCSPTRSATKKNVPLISGFNSVEERDQLLISRRHGNVYIKLRKTMFACSPTGFAASASLSDRQSDGDGRENSTSLKKNKKKKTSLVSVHGH